MNKVKNQNPLFIVLSMYEYAMQAMMVKDNLNSNQNLANW